MLRRVLSRLRAWYDRPLLAVGFLTVAAGALRFYGLGSRPLWFDEAVLYGISRASSMAELIIRNAELNSAPPLFALLLRALMPLGDSEWTLRLLPWAGGVAAIPAIYFLARQFAARTPAYFSAFVVAITSTQIEYSQQLREYSLTFVVAALIMALLVRLTRRPAWSNVALLMLVMAVGIFLQYGLVLLILGLDAVFLVVVITAKRSTGRRWGGWIAVQAAILVAGLAVYLLALRGQWAPGFGGGAGKYLVGTYGAGSAGSVVRLAAANTLDLLSFAFPGRFSFLVLGLLFLIGLLASALESRRTGDYGPLTYLLVPVLLALAAASFKLYPYGGIRQDMFLLPMVYVFAGLGLGWLLHAKHRQAVAIIVALLAVAGALNPIARYWRTPGPEDLRPVVAALDSSFREGDRIYVYYGAQPGFAYYHRRHLEAQVDGTENRNAPEAYLAEVESLLDLHSRVWMVFSHCFSKECDFIPDQLATRYSVNLIAVGEGTKLYLAH